MLRLLERSITSIEQRLVLLAPPGSVVPDRFSNVVVSPNDHREYLRNVQRVRGRVYVRDGAVRPEQLSADGRHQTPEDGTSWHFLIVNKRGDVGACMWYRMHGQATTVEQLRAWGCPLARRNGWREALRQAIENELRRARSESIHYAEAGGWAVSDQERCASDGVVLPLAAFSLSRLFGGGLGLSTATVRHSSACILRRLGLTRLDVDGVPLPAYYDPKYGCEMELLRFDTRRPNPRFLEIIGLFERKLADVPIIVREPVDEGVEAPVCIPTLPAPAYAEGYAIATS